MRARRLGLSHAPVGPGARLAFYPRAMTTVVCAPEWQGSSSPHALHLREGALKTAALVPAGGRVEVPLHDADGEKVAGVRRLDVLKQDLRLIEEFGSACYPEPAGPTTQRVIDLIAGIDDITGASITEHAPRHDSDLARDRDVVRRIGAALCR